MNGSGVENENIARQRFISNVVDSTTPALVADGTKARPTSMTTRPMTMRMSALALTSVTVLALFVQGVTQRSFCFILRPFISFVLPAFISHLLLSRIPRVTNGYIWTQLLFGSLPALVNVVSILAFSVAYWTRFESVEPLLRLLQGLLVSRAAQRASNALSLRTLSDDAVRSSTTTLPYRLFGAAFTVFLLLAIGLRYKLHTQRNPSHIVTVASFVTPALGAWGANALLGALGDASCSQMLSDLLKRSGSSPPPPACHCCNLPRVVITTALTGVVTAGAAAVLAAGASGPRRRGRNTMISWALATMFSFLSAEITERSWLARRSKVIALWATALRIRGVEFFAQLSVLLYLAVAYQLLRGDMHQFLQTCKHVVRRARKTVF